MKKKKILNTEGRKRFFYKKEDRANYKRLKEIMDSEDEVAKRVLVSGGDFNVECFSFTDNEDKVTFSSYLLKPQVQINSCYIKSHIVAYVTYNKKTKTVRCEPKMSTVAYQFLMMLNGSDLFWHDYIPVDVKGLLKGTRFEWLVSGGLGKLKNIHDCITQRTAKGILNGSITNYETLYKKVIGLRGLGGKLDVKKLYGVKNLKEFFQWANLSDNVARDFKMLSLYTEKAFGYGNLFDLVNMSRTVGRKVNFTWSEKRVKLEHDKLSREIQKIRIKGIKRVEIPYTTEPPKQEGIEVLKSNIDFLVESETLKHCLYSANYFQDCLSKRSFIVRYDLAGERGTAEIGLSKNTNLLVRQFRGFGNKSMSKSSEKNLMGFLDNPKTKEWVTKEFYDKDGRVKSNSVYMQHNNNVLPF